MIGIDLSVPLLPYTPVCDRSPQFLESTSYKILLQIDLTFLIVPLKYCVEWSQMKLFMFSVLICFPGKQHLLLKLDDFCNSLCIDECTWHPFCYLWSWLSLDYMWNSLCFPDEDEFLWCLCDETQTPSSCINLPDNSVLFQNTLKLNLGASNTPP